MNFNRMLNKTDDMVGNKRRKSITFSLYDLDGHDPAHTRLILRISKYDVGRSKYLGNII